MLFHEGLAFSSRLRTFQKQRTTVLPACDTQSVLPQKAKVEAAGLRGGSLSRLATEGQTQNRQDWTTGHTMYPPTLLSSVLGSLMQMGPTPEHSSGSAKRPPGTWEVTQGLLEVTAKRPPGTWEVTQGLLEVTAAAVLRMVPSAELVRG